MSVYLGRYLLLSMRTLFTFLSLMCATCIALKMPSIFSTNMVLQSAPYYSRVYGWSSPNTPISIAINKETYRTYTDANGDFTYTLPAYPRSLQSHVLTITDERSLASVAYDNVVFGTVYLCGGQSNMEMNLINAFNGSAEIIDSINYPHLRLAAVNKVQSPVPLNDTTSRYPSDQPSWLPASPNSVNMSCYTHSNFDFFGTFSAACYLAGKEIYRQLKGQVAIGLIEAVWSGTPVQTWMSSDALKRCPSATAQDLSSFEKYSAAMDPSRTATVGEFPPIQCAVENIPNTPTVSYNAQYYPLLRFSMSGMLWYQGESNAGAATQYACLFPAFISDLQLKFGNNFAFFFVLLAGYQPNNTALGWPDTRAAQLSALSLPRTGVASAIDLGDPTSPYGFGGVHCRNKSEVGRRLALNALRIVHQLDIINTAPTVLSITWPLTTSGAQTVLLRFDSTARNAAGLYAADTLGCELCCANSSPIQLGTNDGKWAFAKVSVFADQYFIIATITSSASVNAIRYNYLSFPECTIKAVAQLPVLPFQIYR